MKVQIDVPDQLFWRIAGTAEESGMKVDQWLLRLATTFNPHDPEDGPVAQRWRRGMCDADIAHDLGWTNIRVAVLRRQMGLPANKRKRTTA